MVSFLPTHLTLTWAKLTRRAAVSKLRNYNVNHGTSLPPNVDLVPPPAFANMAMPFPYEYSQNPFVREIDGDEGVRRVVNVTARVASAGFVIRQDEYPVPMGPNRQPDLDHSETRKVMAEFDRAMDERPVWTRRSIINRISRSEGADKLSASTVRRCIAFAGYQFKGGPFRDALVRYGLDPRLDPKYRIYQTLIFKTRRTMMGETGQAWHDVRAAELANIKTAPSDNHRDDSHLFDGKSYYEDGKVWQVCDITDPVLASLFATAEVRPRFDEGSTGWYHAGLWAKVKAIMRNKMHAIRFGRVVSDADYSRALTAPDRSPLLGSKSINIPLPDLKLNREERATLEVRRYHDRGGPKRSRYNKATYPLAPRGTAGKLAAATPRGNGRLLPLLLLVALRLVALPTSSLAECPAPGRDAL